MRLSQGDRIPASKFYAEGSSGVGIITSHDLCAGQTVALFGLEGGHHSPLQRLQLSKIIQLGRVFKQHGIDTIACVAVNEPDRLMQWACEEQADQEILMLADWDARFAEKCGFATDMRHTGLGMVAHRYAMVLTDGAVSILSVNDTVNHTMPAGAMSNTSDAALRHAA